MRIAIAKCDGTFTRRVRDPEAGCEMRLLFHFNNTSKFLPSQRRGRCSPRRPVTNRNRWTIVLIKLGLDRWTRQIIGNVRNLIVIRNIAMCICWLFVLLRRREREVHRSHSGIGVRKRVTEGEENFTKTYPNLT